MKIINGELLQSIIRVCRYGKNLAVVGSHDGEESTVHLLAFQQKDADAVAKALKDIGVVWEQVEVKQSDFYESRTI